MDRKHINWNKFFIHTHFTLGGISDRGFLAHPLGGHGTIDSQNSPGSASRFNHFDDPGDDVGHYAPRHFIDPGFSFVIRHRAILYDHQLDEYGEATSAISEWSIICRNRLVLLCLIQRGLGG